MKSNGSHRDGALGRTAWLAWCSGLALVFLLAMPTAVLAQDDPPEGEEAADENKTPLMQENVYKRLAKAQQLAENQEFEEALKILKKIEGMKDLNTTDLSQLYSFYAYIYHSLDQYDKAIEAYENVIGVEGLQDALKTNTLYTLAQIYLSREEWAKGVEKLNAWFELAENPQLESYILLGQAYYQMEQYQKAIKPVKTAIQMAKDEGRKIEENWWLLLRVFYYEMQDYPKVLEILEELVKGFPKKEYWLQISAVYGELNRQKDQLHTLELAYEMGMLTEKPEILNLVQLLLLNDVPYKAAKILDKGLKNKVVPNDEVRYWRMLSEAWMLSQEDRKAIEPMKKAAELSTEDGELDLVLAQTYLDLEMWDKGAKAAQKAIEKGGLDRPDTAHILLGMALFNAGKSEEATSAFLVAQKDSRSRQMASQWIRYIETELARKADLEALDQN